jgi:hypothetical protein
MIEKYGVEAASLRYHVRVGSNIGVLLWTSQEGDALAVKEA